jgi:hypothetical protein
MYYGYVSPPKTLTTLNNKIKIIVRNFDIEESSPDDEFTSGYGQKR